MSGLEKLRYYLASQGSTAEQIKAVEQDLFQSAASLGLPAERVIYDAYILLLSYAKPAFDYLAALRSIEEAAGLALPTLEWAAIKEYLSALEAPVQPAPQPTIKKTGKTPYYHKEKGQWWK